MPLHVPVADRREPAPRPPAVRDVAPAAVDQRLALRGIARSSRSSISVPQSRSTSSYVVSPGTMAASRSRGRTVPVSTPGGRRALPPELQPAGEAAVQPLGEAAHEHGGGVAQREEERGNEDRPPRLQSREVAELHAQHLGRERLGGLRKSETTSVPGSDAPGSRRAAGGNIWSIGEAVGAREVRDEARGAGDRQDVVALPVVHREHRGRAHVVEAERERAARAGDHAADPRGRPRLHEPAGREVQARQPRLVGELRIPRDADVRRRRARPTGPPLRTTDTNGAPPAIARCRPPPRSAAAPAVARAPARSRGPGRPPRPAAPSRRRAPPPTTSPGQSR